MYSELFHINFIHVKDKRADYNSSSRYIGQYRMITVLNKVKIRGKEV